MKYFDIDYPDFVGLLDSTLTEEQISNKVFEAQFKFVPGYRDGTQAEFLNNGSGLGIEYRNNRTSGQSGSAGYGFRIPYPSAHDYFTSHQGYVNGYADSNGNETFNSDKETVYAQWATKDFSVQDKSKPAIFPYSVFLPLLDTDYDATTSFGIRRLTLRYNKDVLDFTKTNPFDTEFNQRSVQLHFNRYINGAWNPTRDYKTFKEYYRLDDQYHDYAYQYRPLDVSVKEQKGSVPVINPMVEYGVNDNGRGDRFLTPNMAGSRGVAYPRHLDNFELTIIPKVRDTYPTTLLATEVDKNNAGTLLPGSTLAHIGYNILSNDYGFKDFSDIEYNPQATRWEDKWTYSGEGEYFKSRYFRRGILQRLNNHAYYTNNNTNENYQAEKLPIRLHPGLHFGVGNADGTGLVYTNGARRGDRNSPQTNLSPFKSTDVPYLFYYEEKGEGRVDFVWKPRKGQHIVKGEIRVPALEANSISPAKLLPNVKHLAFIPGKFGTSATLSRVKPVGTDSQAALGVKLKAKNTDTVRQQLLTDFLADSGLTGTKATIDHFDEILDAPNEALPFVYDAEDLRVGTGKYRESFVNTPTKTLLNVNDGRPGYVEQFGFNDDWPMTPRTIELHIPYEGTELPSGVDSNWAGIGHVLPFEMATFTSNVLKQKTGLGAFTGNNSRGLITRIDKGLGYPTRSTPNFYYDDYRGKGKIKNNEYELVPETFYLTERFDLDYIYMPPANDIGDWWQCKVLTSSLFEKVTADKYSLNPAYNPLNKPSMFLLTKNFDKLHEAHLPVPHRLLGYYGDMVSYNHEYETLDEAIRGSNSYRLPKNVHDASIDLELDKYPHNAGTPLFRRENPYGTQIRPGHYSIASADIDTAVKMDTFFSNRIVGNNLLDEIRKGRHFDNYVIQVDAAESVNHKDTYEASFNSTSTVYPEGKRYKNFVGHDFRQFVKKTNLDEELAYVRDVKPFKIKQYATYVDSTGLSMIVKPADTSYVYVGDNGDIATHVDQTVYRNQNGKYDALAQGPYQNAVFDEWVGGNTRIADDITYTTKGDVSDGWFKCEAISDYHDNMFTHGNMYYRSLKGTQVPSTTASYLLSFIFNQQKWLERREQLAKVLGVSSMDKVYLSSFAWFDADAVYDSVRRVPTTYKGWTCLNTDTNILGMERGNYGAAGIVKSHMTRWLGAEDDDYIMSDFNIAPELSNAPGLILTGQLNSFIHNASNVVGALPAYFDTEDTHAYDAYSSKRNVRIGQINGIETRSARRWNSRTGQIEYTEVDSNYPNIKTLGYYANHVDRYGPSQADFTLLHKFKNPMISGGALINKRVWEPIDMLIPTRLKDNTSDWTNKDNWVLVNGHEKESSYALMDQIQVEKDTVYVGDVRSFKVSVPVMWRKPKFSFDLSNRLGQKTRTYKDDAPQHADASPFNWFDFLASDEPFSFTFHVADISNLLHHAEIEKEVVSDGITPSYDDTTRILKLKGMTEAFAGDNISDENKKLIRKKIAKWIGISPLLLRIDYVKGKPAYQAVVTYTDEVVGLGIPMFAGQIKVDLKATESNPAGIPAATVANTPVQGELDASSPEDELIAWYKQTFES